MIPNLKNDDCPKEPVKQQTTNSIDTLCKELLLSIFSGLEIKEVTKCSIVNKKWNCFLSTKDFWEYYFSRNDLSYFQTKNSKHGPAWRFRDLSLELMMHEKSLAAIAAGEMAAKITAFTGAYGFTDLCRAACENKNYQIAEDCQQLAKQYNRYAGTFATSLLILARIKEPNFLEELPQLIASSKKLLDDDREFGLECLMEIAKSLANLNKIKDAAQITEQAEIFRKIKACGRPRNKNFDVKPHLVLAKHLLSLKKYEVAEEYAVKLEKPDYFYSRIVLQQIKQDNIFNNKLLSQLSDNTDIWRYTIEQTIFGLLAKKRVQEAKILTKKRFNSDYFVGKEEFRKELKSILEALKVKKKGWKFR